MRGRTIVLVALFTTAALAGCLAEDPDEDDSDAPTVTSTPCFTGRKFPDVPVDPTVELDTSFGTIVVRIYKNAVPVTAENFLSLVRAGTYDGTKFHRIITDFMMQGGDPDSKDDDPANDGAGGTATIADEFHHLLRHDRKGLLSMANRGPNTGSSQFFILFAPAPHLNDKHTVFGEVVEGMDIVEKVNSDAATQDGKPKVPVTLDKATVRSDGLHAVATNEVCIWSPDPSHKVPAEGGYTQFLAVVENGGSHLTKATLSVTAPAGVRGDLEEAWTTFDLPGRQRVAVVLEAAVTDAASTHSIVSLKVDTSDGASATQDFVVSRSSQVGPAKVKEGDTVKGHYIGMMPDGRLFDTSVGSLARDTAVPKFATFQLRGAYDAFDFTPGGGVIQGFTDIAVDTPEGGISAARVPPKDAYGERGQHALSGRTLLFQLEILDIQ